MERVARGTRIPPRLNITAEPMIVGPTPARRPMRGPANAPRRNPTLPTAKITPMTPAFSPSWRTANTRSTGVAIEVKRFEMPVQMAMGNRRRCPNTYRRPWPIWRRILGRLPSSEGTTGGSFFLIQNTKPADHR